MIAMELNILASRHYNSTLAICTTQDNHLAFQVCWSSDIKRTLCIAILISNLTTEYSHHARRDSL